MESFEGVPHKGSHLSVSVAEAKFTWMVIVDRKTDGFQDEISPDIKK